MFFGFFFGVIDLGYVVLLGVFGVWNIRLFVFGVFSSVLFIMLGDVGVFWDNRRKYKKFIVEIGGFWYFVYERLRYFFSNKLNVFYLIFIK